MLMGEVRAERLLRNIDQSVRQGLTAEQLSAVRAAARSSSWQDHPVDLRLSMPSPFGRLFVALIAGREQRHAVRRARERELRPVITSGNLVAGLIFILAAGLAGGCLMALLGGILTQ